MTQASLLAELEAAYLDARDARDRLDVAKATGLRNRWWGRPQPDAEHVWRRH